MNRYMFCNKLFISKFKTLTWEKNQHEKKLLSFIVCFFSILLLLWRVTYICLKFKKKPVKHHVLQNFIATKNWFYRKLKIHQVKSTRKQTIWSNWALDKEVTPRPLSQSNGPSDLNNFTYITSSIGS